ncbi:MAG: recombinase family protein [bacterium]|nr:recombinase family protein [bacterium]
MSDTSQKEIKLIAVYGRVSTSAQEVQETIEAQLLQVHEFAATHGYTVVREYLDRGWSGDIIARPALDELRLDAKRHIWDAVLVYDPDRLGRRYFYQELIMDELQKLGIETLFVTVPPVKDINDRMMGGMRGLFAEYEKAKIAERFRIGKVNRIKLNQVLTTEASYGHTYIPNTGKRGTPGYIAGHYEINETEASILRNIFKWVADEGLTLRGVVRRLRELGILPRKSKRGVWNTSTLSTLLRNTAVIGKARWGASYAVIPEKPLKEQKYKKIEKTSRRMRPEKEWLSVDVPRIIEDDLFYRAGKKMRDNFALMGRNKKNDYMLAGKIWCTCGRRRAGEGPQHGKHLYYRCTDRVYSHPLPRTCMERGINARIADKLVWNKIVGLMSSPDLLQVQLDRWIKARKTKVVSSVGDTKAIEEDIIKLKDQEGRYNKAYGAGLFTIEQLNEYVTPVKEQIIALKSQIAKAKQQENQINATTMPGRGEVESFAKESVEALSDLSFTLKRAILTNVVEKIIGTQQQLQVAGHIPLSLNYVKFFTESRHRRVAQCRKIDLVQGAHTQSGRY